MKDVSDLHVMEVAARQAGLHKFATKIREIRGHRDKIVRRREEREEDDIQDELERHHRIEKGY